MISALQKHLFKEVDNSPLVIFRVIFGILIAAEAGGAILTGWVSETFVEPAFTFTFIGFEWLRVLNGPFMYGYFGCMALMGILVTLGYRYKWAIGTYAILWWGAYLMQKSHYNNHYYLLVLLCFIMLMLPAHRNFSLDARRRPEWKSQTCPQWCIWIFVAQVAIVYFYAAVAKLNPDWLAGNPISTWFAQKSGYPIIGPLLKQEWMPFFVAYGGIAFDLFAVPLLLWRVTRKWVFWVGVFFHLFNSAVFQIGIFPYMMIGFSVFFFPPEQVRAFFFRGKTDESSDERPRRFQKPPGSTPKRSMQKAITIALSIYLLIQFLLPLRHYLFEGNVAWTEEGHRMSWRMMLRSKSGNVHFIVKNPKTAEQWKITPRDHLSKLQARKVGKQPDMIWQFTQYLKKDFEERGIFPVEIYAHTRVSLNGRPHQQLVDTTVNLANVPWEHFKHASWLVKLKK